MAHKAGVSPLVLAGRIAHGTGLSCDVDGANDAGGDEPLYARDVSWARGYGTSGASPSSVGLAAKTPTKLRRAIDDAAAKATAARTELDRSTDGRRASSGDQAEQRSNSNSGASSDPTVGLRTAVRDAIGQLEAIVLDITARVSRTQKGCGNNCKAIVDRVQEFDAGAKYVQRVGFDAARLIAEAALKTDIPFQQRYGSTIVVPDKDRYLSVLDILATKAVADEQALELKRRISTNVTKPLLPLDDAKLPQLLIDVNAFLAADVLGNVRAQIAKFAAQIDTMTAELEELMKQAATAKANEALATADALEDRIIDLMRSIFRANLSRLELVDAGATDSGTSLAAKLEAVMNQSAIAAARAVNNEVAMQALRDAALLDKDRSARHQQHQQALANYAGAVSRSKERLDRNAYQQQLQWDEIAKTLARIEALRAEAEEMAVEHLRVTDVEQKRRKEYAEYQESFAAHREYLRLLQENTSTATDFLDRVDRFLRDARSKIESMKIEEELAKMSTELRKALDAQYTQLSGRCAKRIHALEARRTNALRQKEELVFLAKQATTCNDADKGVYIARSEALQKSLGQLDDKVTNSDAQFAADRDRYFNAMAGAADFNADQNAAVTAIRLRANLREQYTATLGNLIQSHTAVATELHQKVDDHVKKASAISELVKKRRAESSPAREAAKQPDAEAPPAAAEVE